MTKKGACSVNTTEKATSSASTNLGGAPLALMAPSGIYYYYADHLGTPQSLTGSDQAVVWQAHHDLFGRASVTTQAVVNNLRFPGQYFDAETGLHYNYFRDYDPSIGRYIESDPIGLEGGLNTYLYAAANPFRFTDPTGQAIPAVIAGCAANPTCVALAGATAVALGNAISGTLSALSGDDSNIIPFPKSTSDTDEQCPPDDGHEDDGCTF
jgi:RHS repeat-associated protein